MDDNDLFLLYVDKLSQRDMISFNVWEHAAKRGHWLCNMRVRLKKKKDDCSFGMGKSKGAAVKQAYRKLFPAKKKKKRRNV